MENNGLPEQHTSETTVPAGKFYTLHSIFVASFIGSPAAAAILLRRNYLGLGKAKEAQLALIIGILSTIAIFAITLSLPEAIIDRIPNVVIPAIYTAVIYQIAKIKQGEALEKHKQQKGAFYSAWKAAGIGGIFLAGIGVLLVAYVFLKPLDYDVDAYNKGIAAFTKNEEKALQLFTLMDDKNISKDSLINFTANTAIPLWQENIRIVDSMDTMEGLEPDLELTDRTLKEYCELRIQSYNLYLEYIRTDSTDEQQLRTVNAKIDAMTKK